MKRMQIEGSRKEVRGGTQVQCNHNQDKGKEEKMRKIWVISVMVFVLLAMAACAGMQKGGERVLRARGAVAAYEPGKMIKLAAGLDVMSGEEDRAFRAPAAAYSPEYKITPATEVKGDIKPGTRVLIRYTQSGSGQEAPKTALSIDAVWQK